MSKKNEVLGAKLMREALSSLASLLGQPVTLIMGGGGAMILAHGYSLGTSDIDAIPKGITIDELDVLVKEIAQKLQIPSDWLNPYFSTFTHTLPSDYGSRLIEVFQEGLLKVQALGREDLLVMKCFAHRQKDIGHARVLIKRGADIAFVAGHIEALLKRRIPGAQDALDFLDELDEAPG